MADREPRFRYQFDRTRIDALPRELVLEELKAVAHRFGWRRFSRHEFDRNATRCKGSTVLKHFGTWSAALGAIDLRLAPHRANRKRITDAELLAELARVWKSCGHRPSKIEWEAASARYSYTTFKQRFGGWTRACLALVEGMGGTVAAAADEMRTVRKPVAIPKDRRRDIPLKLRLRVLTRDGFRCVLCGGTPALKPGVALHVDHIVAFSKGGPTTLVNLRTLCEDCNRGKGAESS